MGIVQEVGEGVTLLKKGDRIVLPFNVADGRCRNCEEGRTAFCTGVNPGFAGGAYGYVGMLSYPFVLSVLLPQIVTRWMCRIVPRVSRPWYFPVPPSLLLLLCN
jgi:threonine dehydrogenase-like Zn-dependent dehydrogenase